MYVSFGSKVRPRTFCVRCRACVCRCDGDVIYVGHDLNWSEMLQVEDAEFVRAKSLTVPTALDCSSH